tara:strand:- start:28 stop:285 length:258 start_codon:yes stop_codon:yes gene_type:complete
MYDFLDGFSWHSSIGVVPSDEIKFFQRLDNTKEARTMFSAVPGDNFLIHKSTKALWKFSEDSQYIEPLFESDILTEEQILAMEEE